MSETLRRVERQQADWTWQECRLADVKVGDVFRMWEPDGSPVVMSYEGNGRTTVFRATADAREGAWSGNAEEGLRTIVDAVPVPQGSEAP